jgi:hypothetical protein
MLRFTPPSTGEFRNRETGRYFTYRPTNDAWAAEQGFAHEIDVLDGVRYGNVLKTVAHICVDEGITEKWAIHHHSIYGG